MLSAHGARDKEEAKWEAAKGQDGIKPGHLVGEPGFIGGLSGERRNQDLLSGFAAVICD